MAEASPAPSSGGPPQEEVPLTANLQVLSPSVGVNRPLSFAGIPASTTIRQLKEKIRNTLVTKPADDQQRLIHRGRLLARDTETLEAVFGAETLQSGDQQTLHLVLRDLPEHHASSQQPTPLRGQSPAPGTFPTRPIESQIPPHPHSAHARLVRTPVQAIPNAQVPIPDMAHPSLASQMQMMQRQHEAMVHQTTVQWMNQIQREAGYRQLLNQQQRERAMGMHGAQDSNPQGPIPGDSNPSGRNSPAIGQPMHNVTREVIGPNGQYWRMTMGEAVVGPRTSSPQPNAPQVGRGPLGPADVHNILRNADTAHATRTMTNAMHRSASGASLANMANINTPIQPIPPGVTTPLFPNGSRHGSRTATPDPTVPNPIHGSTSTPSVSQNTQQNQPPQGQPEVYILSSPSGPRALLVNSASDVYFTPSPRPLATRSIRSNIQFRQPLHQTFQWTPQIHAPQHHAQPQGQQIQLQQPLPQGQVENQAQAQVAPGAVPVQQHPHNPGVGALVAAALPHIWLIVRLIVFVWLWWFMASDRSLSRWFAVIFIAIAAFAINTGLLNGVANQAWETFRRHVEGPIHFPGQANAGDEARNAAVVAAGNNGAAPAERALPNPDPAAAAARLVEERRNANANWLMDQVRRLERAGLLFLASIAPGVAERHIAHLEAQEREERQRREAEETAAREAAAREAAEKEAAEKEAAEKEAVEKEDPGRGTEAENAGPAVDDGWTGQQGGDETRAPLAVQESLL